MELWEHTACQLQKLLEDGETTSQEITDSFLRQISEQEPTVGAFITITKEQAKAHAKASDERRRQGNLLSAFDGVPLAVKDNISTKGIKTTCASQMLKDYVPPYNATVMEKVLGAGLPLLGKTNMDEFAMGSSTENSSIKLTKNPLDPKKVPGGSSGGSAAAVASMQVPWALGSDTGGSIREPASFCGLVGIKPTYGRVSRFGLIAFASSLDQIGPLARTVEDAAALLQVISGHDPQDSTSAKYSVPDYLAALQDDVKGLRIGLPDEYFGNDLDPEIKAAIMAAVGKLERAGASVREISLPTSQVSLETYYLIADAEASSNLARYDGVRYGLRVEGEDITSMFSNTRTQGFGHEVKRRIMLGTYVLSAGYYQAYYQKAQAVRTKISEEFATAFKQVDIIITPTTTTTAFDIGEKLNPLQMYLADIYTVTANLAGIPALSMPVGSDRDKLPIGLQMIGKHYSEAQLLRVAYTLEKLLRGGA